MKVTTYTFDPSTYADFLPQFNDEFADYITSDVNNDDGTITRTIEHSSTLPTKIRFGDSSGNTDRTQSLKTVEYVDVSNLDKATNMFRGNANLTSINFINSNSSITDMMNMFVNCNSLTQLDLSNFDTSNVTNMQNMFQSCYSLEQINLSHFNTSKVTNMSQMFHNCFSLTELDLSNFDTSQVTDMNGMFSTCSSLTQLDLSNFDTSQVTTMNSMFNNCSSLTQLDLSNFDTSQVTDMNGMFSTCSSLTQLDLSNFDTSQVTNMNGMFFRCSRLQSLDLSSFNTTSLLHLVNTFYDCISLTKLDLSSFRTPKLISMDGTFSFCFSLTQLDLSNFDTSQVTDMTILFDGVIPIRKIKIKNPTSQLVELLPTKTSDNPGYIFSYVEVPNDKYWNTIIMNDGYDITINSPIPLRRIGDIKDRFYFDNEKGYYCIEQNIGKVVLDGSEDEDWNISGSSSIDRINTMAFRLSNPMIGSVYNIKCDKFITCSRENDCSDTDNEGVVGIGGEPYYLCLGIKKSKLPTQDVAGFRQWLSSNPTTILYVLEAPNIIEFPELTNQPRLYQKEDTTISISTDIVEPSKIEVEYKDINNQ